MVCQNLGAGERKTRLSTNATRSKVIFRKSGDVSDDQMQNEDYERENEHETSRDKAYVRQYRRRRQEGLLDRRREYGRDYSGLKTSVPLNLGLFIHIYMMRSWHISEGIMELPSR